MVKKSDPRPKRKPVIGLVGGKGQMGQWLSRFFRRKGLEVKASDLRTRLTNEAVLQHADIVFFCLSPEAAARLIPRLVSRAKPGSLLCDLSSVQEKTVPLLAESAPASVGVSGFHPLFGPSQESLDGQTVLLCPVRPNRWLAFLRSLFRGEGAFLQAFPPAEHDRLMAVLHAAAYQHALGFARELLDAGLTLRQAKRLSTSSGRHLIALTENVFAMEAWLVSRVLFGNRFVEAPTKNRKQFERVFSRMKKALAKQN